MSKKMMIFKMPKYIRFIQISIMSFIKTSIMSFILDLRVKRSKNVCQDLE